MPWLIRRFNERFFNSEFFDTHPEDTFKLIVEENRIIEDDLLNDVFSFCVDFEIPKKLGLSPTDIMQHFDLGTYARLKDMMVKRHKEHMKAVEQTKAQIEKRQQDLMKGTNHATNTSRQS